MREQCERMAQYLHLDSWLFWALVQSDLRRGKVLFRLSRLGLGKRDNYTNFIALSGKGRNDETNENTWSKERATFLLVMTENEQRYNAASY